MRSKVAVIASLLFVLAIGGAAMAVNTRILNTAPQPDIGRANEVLVPGGGQPATAPATATPTVVPTAPTTAPPAAVLPRNDDEHNAGERSTPHEAGHERDD
ncbi:MULTISPECIES: hypothetical protein [Mycobacteriaceae]|uniref:hypothetical protein n=1 Tax=Mycobacteriaceae TaxID=1762 RepID=UPI002939017F|nr:MULTISPECIES: hypothetical protein [Mycobacteriaceae]MDV3136733.1 hypothetical protein [Mycobacterium sp. 29Ha]WSE55946.1 hypothetical protein QGN32_21715 [Mycolicibacterium sp. ND9-15]